MWDVVDYFRPHLVPASGLDVDVGVLAVVEECVIETRTTQTV